MRKEIIATDNQEYEVWLIVAEHDDQAVWEIHIDGLWIAISEWVDFDDSLTQAEQIIEDLESQVASGKHESHDAAVRHLYEQFRRLNGHLVVMTA